MPSAAFSKLISVLEQFTRMCFRNQRNLYSKIYHNCILYDNSRTCRQDRCWFGAARCNYP